MNPSIESFIHWIHYINMIYMDVIALRIKFDGSYYILGELHSYYESKHDWVSHLNPKDSLQGLPNSPFSSFFIWLVLCFTIFFMSNEIILFQFLYRPLKYLFFSFMKEKKIKFIQCEPCFINAQIFFEIWFS